MLSAESNLSAVVLMWKMKSWFPFFEKQGLHPKFSGGRCTLQSLVLQIGKSLSFV